MPATPTVTYVDNADGTGATATISGSTAGSTNRVFTARWFNGFVGGTPTEVASRVGDGTVVVPAVAGLWWAVVRSDSGSESAFSVFSGFRASSAALRLHRRCCDALKDFILALSLPNFPAGKAVVMKLPWRAVQELGPKGAIVSPLRESWVPTDGDNARDDIGYRCQVSWLQAKNGNLVEGMDDTLAWREIFGLAVSQTTLAGVQEIYRMEITPGAIYVPEHALANYDVGGMIVTCFAQRLLGIS